MIAIIGSGGHGQTVYDVLISSGNVGLPCYFFDDNSDQPVKSLFDRSDFDSSYIIVGIGDNAIRKRLCDEVIVRGGRLWTVHHAISFVSPQSSVGDGSSIHFGAHVGPRCIIGKGCIINNLVTIGHDCEIGDYVNVCDGTVFGGGVKVGDEAFIGLNSTVLPKARIGKGAFIGAGSVVVNHVKDGERVSGNPARPI
jgi:sugar O-acyltransferase (sialic acid O-acetyltransferase NeuD family)